MTDNALAKVDNLLPAGPISDIETLDETWRQLESACNIVTPVGMGSAIPAMHAVAMSAVKIDPTMDKYGSGREVYRSPGFCDTDEAALTGVALSKIAAAAGVKQEGRKRLDDRSEPYYCEIEVTISLRDFDGTTRTVTRAKEVDLRDGAPETLKPEKVKGPNDKYPKKTGKLVPLSPADLANKRVHIQSLAETKAWHRALRVLLSIKQKYKLAELDRPFVVPKLIPNLDPSDPDQKQALMALATGQEGLLFGAPTALPPGPTRELKDITPTPDNPRGASDSSASNEEAKPEAAPDAFEPMEFPEPDPGLVYTCGCPCGDQVELTEEIHQMTAERCGSPRCVECFPGRRFNVEKHRELADLELPKHPGLTVDQIEAGIKAGPR